MLTLAHLYDARTRIGGYVRQTPLTAAAPVKVPLAKDVEVYLKLENMQITGSFKARGAVNKLLTLPPAQVKRGILAASGGNHGLGVAYAGWIRHAPVTIYLGGNAPRIKAQQLEDWGATVIYEGAVWDDANRAALAHAERDDLAYLHPFADQAVIAGQGTLGLEILDQLPSVDMLIVSIGGGGLISGVSFAAKHLRPGVKVIGVEPVGAPTLYESLRAGQVIELSEVRTKANTLAPRMSAQVNLDLIREHVDEIVLVTDEDMLDSARWLWTEMGIAAELSGAAALAALRTGKVRPLPGQKVCAVVCGAGTDGIGIEAGNGNGGG
jgi:threonine dehydratase